MRNLKLVTDLKLDIDSKNASVRPMSNGWAIQLYEQMRISYTKSIKVTSRLSDET